MRDSRRRTGRRMVLLAGSAALAGCYSPVAESQLAGIKRVGVVAAIGNEATLYGYGRAFLASPPTLDIASLDLDRKAAELVAESLRARDPEAQVRFLGQGPESFKEPGDRWPVWPEMKAYARANVSPREFDAVVFVRKGVGGLPDDRQSPVWGLGISAAQPGLFNAEARAAAFCNIAVAVVHGTDWDTISVMASPWARAMMTRAQMDARGIRIPFEREGFNAPDAMRSLESEYRLLLQVAIRSALFRLGFRVQPAAPPSQIQTSEAIRPHDAG